MITLTTFVSDEMKNEFITQASYDKAVEYFSDFWESSPKTGNFGVDAAEGDDGLVYRDIKFNVSAKYIIDGERWFSGGGFRINLDHVLALIKTGIKG